LSANALSAGTLKRKLGNIRHWCNRDVESNIRKPSAAFHILDISLVLEVLRDMDGEARPRYRLAASSALGPDSCPPPGSFSLLKPQRKPPGSKFMTL